MLRPSFWLPLLIAAALIYALAYVTTGRPELVFWYAIGIVASFLVLRFAGWAAAACCCAWCRRRTMPPSATR